MAAKKWVYRFDELDQAEQYVGDRWEAVRGLFGGKGANLADMQRIGLPVPPGFTITTEACNAYLQAGGVFPEGMWAPVHWTNVWKTLPTKRSLAGWESRKKLPAPSTFWQITPNLHL